MAISVMLETAMIVLLHGWSDRSESFKPLAAELARLGLQDIVPI